MSTIFATIRDFLLNGKPTPNTYLASQRYALVRSLQGNPVVSGFHRANPYAVSFDTRAGGLGITPGKYAIYCPVGGPTPYPSLQRRPAQDWTVKRFVRPKSHLHLMLTARRRRRDDGIDLKNVIGRVDGPRLSRSKRYDFFFLTGRAL